ncbi:hypothetical protein Tsubulata_044121 [Turnera subulata]|uniref:Protein POLLENLESS 3 n=1 Tax=Turnera subulata TaxID=218843 RepID=A0A9Q0G463_9ROSI|nr:hypothetical protein Tsubulata_044121 [Turnera subulata]
MWGNNDENVVPARRFFTPPAAWRPPRSPGVAMPMSETRSCKRDLFHVIHKVPEGDSPYVRAKHVQLIEKDPSRAISLFWSAINSGDRIDSALKDMAVVMKQLDRSDEAIEAIRSFRHLCPTDSQESIDNLLIELYKRAGRIEEEIEMLQKKLKNIEDGIIFGGRRTKIARSQGKKIQITVGGEKSRVLGNLAWAYLQQHNYGLAEKYYRKALSMEPDKNKQCNLAICLMHMNRIPEARSLLQAVEAGSKPMDDSYAKSFERASEMLTELDLQPVPKPSLWNRNDKRCLMLPPTNGDQDHRSGSVDSIRRPGHTEERLPSVHNNMRRSSHVGHPSERPRFTRRTREDGSCSNGTATPSAKKNAFASPALQTQPRDSYWGLDRSDQRRERREEEGAVRNLNAFASPALQTQPGSNYRGFNSNDQRRESRGEEGAVRNLSVELVDQSDATEKTLEKVAEGSRGGSGVTVIGELERGEAAGSDRILGQNSSTRPPRKTWADMVEEEEQQSLAEEKLNQMFSELKLGQEEYNDENVNANILHRGSPMNLTPALCQKLDNGLDSDVEDGHDTPGGSAVLSRNATVRRSLSFEDGEEKDTKRRTRLQVFREITPSPDSP